MYECFERTLTDKEIRYCKTQINGLEKKMRSAFSIIAKQTLIGFGFAILLCLLGYLASKDKPPAWFFWLIFLLPGSVLAIWLSLDSIKAQKRLQNLLINWKNTLSCGKARVERIQAERMIEIAEKEDEGACYLFEVGPNRLFLLTGQAYYPSAKFPSSDFSLIDILDPQGNCLASIIEKQGNKLKPYRTIDAKNKVKDLIPYYEEKFLGCGIDEVEEYLKGHVRAFK